MKNPFLRKLLDRLYEGGGMLAALFLLLSFGAVVTQVFARWSGTIVPGAAEYTGYFMSASSFLALAYTLKHGGHIRVSLLISKLGRHRIWGEIWCYGLGSLLSVYFAYYAFNGARWSWKLNDVSQGQDALPTWIPQIGMVAGVSLFAIAMLDQFISVLRGDLPPLDDPEAPDAHAE